MAESNLAIDPQRAAAAARFRAQVLRSRLDYRWLPDGQVQAILTVTLPNGHMMRFTAEGNPHDILAALQRENPHVIAGFSLGGLWRGIKKVAKTVATSKVFKIAAGALAVVAPFVGPLAPVLFAGAGAMKATTALLAAKVHAAAGNLGAAKTLVSYAGSVAKTPTVFHASTSLASNAAARAGLPAAPVANPLQAARTAAAARSALSSFRAPGAASSFLGIRNLKSPAPFFTPARPTTTPGARPSLFAMPRKLTANALAKPIVVSKPGAARALPLPVRATLAPQQQVYQVKQPGTSAKIYALLLKPA